MFRIGLKFPCNGLNRVCKVKRHEYSRLCLTARYHDGWARVKCSPDARCAKDVKLMSRYSGLKYSTDSPRRSGKSAGTSIVLTLSALTVGTIGILYYVKQNPELRATLEGWIPGTDRTIQLVFLENASMSDLIPSFFGSAKENVLSGVLGGGSEKKPVSEKPAPPAPVPEELKPKSLVDLEKYCGDAAAEAIAAYQKAMCAIRDFNKDVMKVVEDTGSSVGGAVWDSLKDATDKSKEALNQAEHAATEALHSLKKMYSLIDDPQLEAPVHMKVAAKRNVKKILDDVDDARKKYEDEQKNCNITERYWQQIKKARETFNKELEILFPNMNINEMKLNINESAFDLFVLHMYNKLNSLQKELEKLRTVSEAKVKSALRASGEDATQEKLDALIAIELSKQKQCLEDEFSKKLLEEQKKYDDEIRRQLKLHSEIYSDRIRDAVQLKQEEATRQLNRALKMQHVSDSATYKKNLAQITGRLRGLEDGIKARLEEEKVASNAHILWAACQALDRAIQPVPAGVPVDKAIRPLEPEMEAICKAAVHGDPLVTAVMRGIPEEAIKRGVFPEGILRERFLKVENVARKLAMIPEEGAALPIYLLSYIQSLLVIKTSSPISKTELKDEPFDVKSLDTYDILHRARYWLDRGDFKMTLRYMNLLTGAPRSIAKEWMNEARILLETKQAIDTLLAYAGSTSLMFINTADVKTPTGK